MRHIHESHTVAPDHHVVITTAPQPCSVVTPTGIARYVVTFYHGRRPEHHQHVTSLAKARRIVEDFARTIN